MGKNNKQRRAAKKKRQRAARQADASRRRDETRQHHHGDQPRTGRARASADPPPPIEDLVHAAVHTWESDEAGHTASLEVLDARAGSGEPVLATVEHLIHEALGGLWEQGWTPADVVHVAGRRLSAAHADVMTRQVVADGQARTRAGQAMHPRWRAQLDALEARRAGSRATDTMVRLAVTVLCLLMRLAAVPPTVPHPGSPDITLSDTAGLDQRMLARVRALLAKAESTEFEEEAEALTAKAQELITRHSIADALLHEPDDVGDPSVRRILIDDPYADAKAVLLSSVAEANRCRLVYGVAQGWVTVFGFDSDLDAVELLAASLLTQATGAMVRHGSRRDAVGRSTTRSFRRSFLVGFAARIGDRLRATSEDEVSAAADASQQRLLPVLAARDDRVHAAQAAMFPQTVNRSASASNATGWHAGQAAADLVDLDVSAGRLNT